MPTRNVVSTDHQERVIADLVSSGRYQNASEGLRLLEDRAAREAARLEALREAVRRGFADLDAGRSAEAEALPGLTRKLGRQADAQAGRRRR